MLSACSTVCFGTHGCCWMPAHQPVLGPMPPQRQQLQDNRLANFLTCCTTASTDAIRACCPRSLQCCLADRSVCTPSNLLLLLFMCSWCALCSSSLVLSVSSLSCAASFGCASSRPVCCSPVAVEQQKGCLCKSNMLRCWFVREIVDKRNSSGALCGVADVAVWRCLSGS